MEIKTCDEYVLAELSEAKRNLEAAHKEITNLNKTLSSIEEYNNRPVIKKIVEFGRSSMMQNFVWTTSSVIECNRVISFDEWVNKSIFNSCLPSEVSVEDFIEEFEPELRERYESNLSEESASEE